ncbi:MAG TPA: ribosome maturation factor RimM [Vicinamibacterales bacterium]|nr:ribosome maturation factor RimM [Vicinamibacterales bacterium]
MGDAAWSAKVTVGRVIRPHGNKGQVVVAPETDFGEERFRIGSVLDVLQDGRDRQLVVNASRLHDGRWVVGFDGVASIDDAETLRGLELKIAAAAVTPLEPGRYYLYDLEGCTVETVDGERVGVVERVDTGSGPAMLVVAGRGGEVLVPFVDAICASIDVPGQRIVIRPIEGLIDLNR